MDIEFTIKDVLVYIIENIKKIIVVVLIITLLFAAYGGHKAYIPIKAEAEIKISNIIFDISVDYQFKGVDMYTAEGAYYSAVYGDDIARTIAKTYELIALNDSNIIQGIRNIVGTNEKADDIKKKYSVVLTNNHIICLTATHQDAATANKIVDFLYEQLNEKIDSLYNNYKITKIHISDSAAHDISSDVSDTTTQKISVKTLVAIIVKYAVIGFILGLILGCGFCLLAYLLSNRINSVSCALQLYPNNLLCVFPTSSSGKLFHNIIKKLKNINLEPVTAEQCYDIVAVHIKNIEGKVLLIGTCAKDDIQNLANKLDSRVNAQVIAGGNILLDQEAINIYQDSTQLIIIEKRGQSVIQEVAYEITKAEKADKKILGFVLI